VHYVTHAEGKRFDPANITFDLLVPLEEEMRKKVRDKRERHRIQCERALAAFDQWWTAFGQGQVGANKTISAKFPEPNLIAME
jgi:folate-dependent tRNA-U54 methylase TrmFO/GidA